MDISGTPKRRVDIEMGTSTSEQPSTESLGTIVTGIVKDLQDVVRGEVQLAKAEIKEDVSSLGKSAAMIVGGAFLALVGFMFVMLGVTYLLNKSMQMWLAAGIVGVLLLIIGIIAAMAGKNKLSAANLKPEQTIDSLKEDQQWANRQIKSVKK